MPRNTHSIPKGTFRDTAVAHEKYSKHIKNSFRKVINCRVLPQFALSFYYTYIVKSITKRAKCGKSRQIEDINRSKNVVETGMCYYANIFIKQQGISELRLFILNSGLSYLHMIFLLIFPHFVSLLINKWYIVFRIFHFRS